MIYSFCLLIHIPVIRTQVTFAYDGVGRVVTFDVGVGHIKYIRLKSPTNRLEISAKKLVAVARFSSILDTHHGRFNTTVFLFVFQ